MVNDAIADLLTRIRNAQVAGHKSARISNSKMGGRVLAILKSEGFIESYELKDDGESGFKVYEAWLRYFESGDPLIRTCKRVSTPGRRVYSGADKLLKIRGGLGISIVSTSQGVMSDREARRLKIGGEVLAVVG